MKNSIKILCLTLLMTGMVFSSVYGERHKGDVRRSGTPKGESATCLPASSSNELTVNNVRAYIETGGTMWFKEVAEYEVPYGSGKTSMFSAALWIGGLDANDQLKLAAVRFRQVGDDYWTGPLKIGGNEIARTTQSECVKYDKLFSINRADVDAHIAGYNTSGYVMPSSIANWPAHGDEGYSYYLAPFKDVNENGEYDPENGDYPYYDIDNSLCPWTEDNIALAAAHALPRTPEDLMYYPGDWRNSNGMIYADHVLKGDATLFWIFNDNGGPHTESQGSPIGLEIRGQCFGFSTNDDLNNMTFYSYEIINRSTYVLKETYFSQWVDPDLGYAYDDYVGCDVARGLGYCYNGSNVDGSGEIWAYGDQPPAVGVDFFQGPYMDPDGRDNPKFHPDSAKYSGYCEKFLKSEFELDQMAINGVNFGDRIIDNERFGMRRFVYHNNDGTVVGDPSVAFEYYNMLKGIWKDNTKMRYGGNAHSTNGGNGPECDFMFPAMTDVCNWGTAGVDPSPEQFGTDGWTEANVGNPPFDRRFMQSAGPFTLQPGSVNYITVGIPWARASSGGAQASVALLKVADDKCQSLFENCFKTLDGPDAPDITIRELENKLILYISNNDERSNNYHETYSELDPQISKTLSQTNYVNVFDTVFTHDALGNPDMIVTPSTVPMVTTDTLSKNQRSYVFEGYQIYQLANRSVSATDLSDPAKAVLIGQCDIENYRENGLPIGKLVNWIYNDAVDAPVATEMVNGANKGIYHSLEITEDKFATGTNKALVNHKTYYFMVLAYGYNEFKTFNMEIKNLDGQQKPYLAGRRNIKVYPGTPHKPVESLLNSSYGDQPMITRIEGQGNGGYFLEMTDESRRQILQNTTFNNVQYKQNHGPVGIKVVDPLNVKPLDFILKFLPNDVSDDVNDSTMWELIVSDNVSDEELAQLGVERVTLTAMPISMTNEQLFLDFGIAVSVKNYPFKIHQKNLREYLLSQENPISFPLMSKYGQVDFIGSTIKFDGEARWLGGVHDMEGDYPGNWIHAGQQATGHWYDWQSHGGGEGQIGAEANYMVWRTEDFFTLWDFSSWNEVIHDYTTEPVRGFKDPNQQFEDIVNGTWSPYILSSPYDGGPQAKYLRQDVQPLENKNGPIPAYFEFYKLTGGDRWPGYNPTMTNLYSVDIVLTPDKSKWSRALVLESGSAPVDGDFHIKQDFYGNTYLNIRHEPKTCPSVDKDGKPDNSGTTGFGWFPGYAINVETGERLNIMFAENSEDVQNNGNDMIFNPTNVYAYARDMRTGEYLRDSVTGDLKPLNQGVYNALHDIYGITLGEPANGGRHYVYVCGSSGNSSAVYVDLNRNRKRNYNDGENTVLANYIHHGGRFTGTDGVSYPYYECGPYDECAWLSQKFATFTNTSNYSNKLRMNQKMQVFNNVMWTSIPMPEMLQEDAWLSCDATIKIRVSRPYMRYSSRWYDDCAQAPDASQNEGYPMYSFSTADVAPLKVKKIEDMQTILDEINIVPNPYYGFSQYEATPLENYVRIVNLPAHCTVSIFTVNGTLIRTLTKGSAASSYVQWDLKNHANIPVASGVYIIHVKAPGIGERTLKFFCAMRPTDLNGF